VRLTDDMLAGVDNVTVFDGLIKARAVLLHHKKVSVSISGGSDSDIVLDIIEKCRNDENEINYVWFDTGLEYMATRKHLRYLEERYGITIERIKAEKSIPTCCREIGQPFLSKYISQRIMQLQKGGFQWEDGEYEELRAKYPACPYSAIKWWCNQYTKELGWHRVSRLDIDWRPHLKKFLMAYPPQFRISNKCCTYAKKNPAIHHERKTNADLIVMGIRRAEGGVRQFMYKGCYTHDTTQTPTYRPVFWYSDDDKRYYDEHFGIVHSDCYTKYGLKRTGCVGCPYSKAIGDELHTIEVYEPKLAKACKVVFKDAYEYTRMFRDFAGVMHDNLRQNDGQMTIYDYKEGNQ